MWQHRNIPHPSLIWFQPILTCSLHWNQHLKGRCFCDASDIIKNSLKDFHKMASRKVPNILTVASKVYNCTRGLFWRKYSLNYWTVLHLWNKVIQGTFWSHHIFHLHIVSYRFSQLLETNRSNTNTTFTNINIHFQCSMPIWFLELLQYQK